MQHHMPYGYQMSDGIIVIVNERADIVCWIFQTFISNVSLNQIAKLLNEMKIQSSREKVAWTHAAIGNIIRNRKYLGDECFPAIIDKEMFNQAQNILKKSSKRMDESKRIGKCKFLYSGRIVCGECGGRYRRDKIRNLSIWRCRYYIKDNHVYCRNRYLTDQELEDAGKDLLRQLLRDSRTYKRQQSIEGITDISTDLDTLVEQEKLHASPEQLLKLYFRRTEDRYALLKIDDSDYLTEKIEQALELCRGSDAAKVEDTLKDIVTEVIIYKDGRLIYKLINGTRITKKITKGEG